MKPLNLCNRRIFITGGTGFLGRSLLDYLIENQDQNENHPQVTILTRSPERFLNSFPEYSGISWMNFVKGDLARLPSVVANEFTDVIHGAADTHSNSDAILWLSQLTQGTKNVLEFARQANAKRFLFISSGAIYGEQEDGTVSLDEDVTIAPQTTDVNSTYSNGKRFAEHLCAIYSAHPKGPSCTIARCFAIISRHIPLSGPYALGNFIRDSLLGKDITITGDGKTIRSYIDGRDMAHWLFTILEKGERGQAYNIGSDKPITLLEAAKNIRDITNPTLAVQVLNQHESISRAVYLPNISKANKLGLKINIPFNTAINDAIKWINCND